MRVILFRHGPAGSRDAAKWPDDSERPLTGRGADKTLQAAAGLLRLEPALTRIITSPLRRAEQTARLLHQVAGSAVTLETLEALAPGGSHRAVIAKLAEVDADSTVALVGHEPGMGGLAAILVLGMSPAADLPLKKAGACAVRFQGAPRAGDGELHWLLPPKQLRRLGGKQGKKGARA
jgi:phosphohistidine phosphatase